MQKKLFNFINKHWSQYANKSLGKKFNFIKTNSK